MSVPLLPALAMFSALSMAVLSGCDRFLSPEDRIARAQKQYEAANFGAATADVKTALERAPDHAQGRLLLARLSLRVGDVAGAEQELGRAIEAGAPEAETRELHYRIRLAQARYEDVIADASAETVLPPLRRHVLLATAQTALQRFDEATKNLDQALALAPDDPQAQLVRARLYLSTGQNRAASEAAGKLVEQHPELASAALLQGQIAATLGDWKLASEAFDRARKLGGRQLEIPEQITALTGLVESQLALGNIAAAEASLKSLEQATRQAPATGILKARIAYAKRDFTAAANAMRSVLLRMPDYAAGRVLLGAALLEQGALEQAESELRRVISVQPDNADARRLLARIHVSRNNLGEASRVLEGSSTPDAVSDWMNGSIHLLTGQTEEAIALLEQSVAAKGDDARVRLDLAQAYLIAGRAAEALQQLQAVPAAEGGDRRSRLLVLAEVAGEPLAEAKRTVLRLAAQHPTDATLQKTAAGYLLGVGATDDAERLFTQLIAADPKDADAHLGLAVLYLQKREIEAAEEGLRKVIGIAPSDERAYLALAGIEAWRGDRAAARQWLEKAVGARPEAIESRLRLAELAFADGDPMRANAMLDQALGVTTNRGPTLARVGAVLFRAQRFDDALKRFDDAASLGITSASLDAARALYALNRREEARQRLETLVRARPGSAAAVALLVRMDLEQKQTDRALTRIAALAKAGAPADSVEELRGSVLLAAGRPAAAAEAFQRAATLRPTSARAVQLYEARLAAKQRAPEAVLVEWLAKNPQDVALRTRLAEHHLQVGNRAAAIQTYEAAGMQASAVLLNNLAWLYFEAQDERALELARRAHEAAPGSAAIADTYGWILLGKGRTDEGLKLLEQAAKGAPTEPDVQYHYAMALARAGKKDEAVAALRKLLADGREFPSRSEAQTLLQTLT